MFKSFKTIFLEEISGWGGNQYKSTRKKKVSTRSPIMCYFERKDHVSCHVINSVRNTSSQCSFVQLHCKKPFFIIRPLTVKYMGQISGSWK